MLGIIRFCQTVRRTSPVPISVCDVGDGTHLVHGQAADRDRDADVVEVGLRLGMDADVSGAIDGAARLAFRGRETNERKGQQLFGFGEELLDAPTVDEVFEPSFFCGRCGRHVAEDAHHGCGYGDGLVGTKEHATIGRELLMAGDSAEQHAKINVRRNAFAVADADRQEADVVGIGQHADGPAIVESDIELARQLV